MGCGKGLRGWRVCWSPLLSFPAVSAGPWEGPPWFEAGRRLPSGWEVAQAAPHQPPVFEAILVPMVRLEAHVVSTPQMSPRHPRTEPFQRCWGPPFPLQVFRFRAGFPRERAQIQMMGKQAAREPPFLGVVGAMPPGEPQLCCWGGRALGPSQRRQRGARAPPAGDSLGSSVHLTSGPHVLPLSRTCGLPAGRQQPVLRGSSRGPRGSDSAGPVSSGRCPHAGVWTRPAGRSVRTVCLRGRGGWRRERAWRGDASPLGGMKKRPAAEA